MGHRFGGDQFLAGDVRKRTTSHRVGACGADGIKL